MFGLFQPLLFSIFCPLLSEAASAAREAGGCQGLSSSSTASLLGGSMPVSSVPLSLHWQVIGTCEKHGVSLEQSLSWSKPRCIHKLYRQMAIWVSPCPASVAGWTEQLHDSKDRTTLRRFREGTKLCCCCPCALRHKPQQQSWAAVALASLGIHCLSS